MEYVIGPVLSLLLALKVGDYNTKKRAAEIELLQKQVEALELTVKNFDEKLPAKVLTTVMPIAKAVQKLNTEVGL